MKKAHKIKNKQVRTLTAPRPAAGAEEEEEEEEGTSS